MHVKTYITFLCANKTLNATKHLMQLMDLALLIVADKGLELMCVKTVTIDLLITADMTLAFLQLENNKLNIRG